MIMTAGHAPLSNDYAVVLTFEKISKDEFYHFGPSRKSRRMNPASFGFRENTALTFERLQFTWTGQVKFQGWARWGVAGQSPARG